MESDTNGIMGLSVFVELFSLMLDDSSSSESLIALLLGNHVSFQESLSYS
jgi:hypothetical protein